MNHIHILFFASLRDTIGTRSLEMDVAAGTSVSALIASLVNAYPPLERMKDSLQVAINHEYATGEQTIPENAEIAFIPPVSGG